MDFYRVFIIDKGGFQTIHADVRGLEDAEAQAELLRARQDIVSVAIIKSTTPEDVEAGVDISGENHDNPRMANGEPQLRLF